MYVTLVTSFFVGATSLTKDLGLALRCSVSDALPGVNTTLVGYNMLNASSVGVGSAESMNADSCSSPSSSPLPAPPRRRRVQGASGDPLSGDACVGVSTTAQLYSVSVSFTALAETENATRSALQTSYSSSRIEAAAAADPCLLPVDR